MLSNILKNNLAIFLFACLGLGIAFYKMPILFLAGISIFLGLIFFCAFKKIKDELIILFFLFLVFLSGFFYTKIKEIHYQKFTFPLNTNLKLTLKIINQPVLKNKNLNFLACTDKGKNKILVKLPHNLFTAHYANQLAVEGCFIPIKKPTNPGQFNYEAYLFNQGIQGIFYARNANLLKSNFGNPLKKIAYALKDKILIINKKTLPFPYSELYTSLIFGDAGTQMPEDMQNKFKKTGLTHLLVVSGAQVALLTGVLLTLFNILYLPFRQSFFLITLINLIFYFLTGGGASIFRAILMNELVLGIKLFKRNASVYHIFSLTGFIMLLINPLSLFDVGAQLSFIATFALIFGVPKVAKLLPEKLPEGLRQALAVSISPFIFTAPILWHYFYTASPIALLSNFLVLSAIEFIVPIGFFSTLIGFFLLPLTQLINNFSLVIMWLLNQVIDILSQVPLATINLKPSSIMLVILVYIFILLFLENALSQNSKKFYYTLLFGLVLAIFIIFPAFLPHKYLKLTFIDVGQGDAILLETPNRKNILIDVGSKISSSLITGVLAYKGINKLDALILTHFHEDHIGGLPLVLEKFSTKLILDNGAGKEPKNYIQAKKYFTALEQKKLVPIQAFSGQQIDLGKNLSLKILYPPSKNILTAAENDNSIVVKISYKNIDFLFTGDAGEKKEYELVMANKADLEAEVFKLGHHGSRFSNSQIFLNTVKPIFAVASVGEKNKYGHPAEEVVERINAAKIKLLRTDKNGAIEFLSDGKNLYYKTFVLENR